MPRARAGRPTQLEEPVAEESSIFGLDRPVGNKADLLHQAMLEISDASRPAGTVAQVIQPGYMIGERVLRPALVAVAKGGPKAAGPEPSANDNLDVASQEPDT